MNTTSIVKSGLRSIKSGLRRLANAPEPRYLELITIPIAECRHYCGFRYGSAAFNPYENYVVGLHRGADVAQLRARFDDHVRHFRPRTFGEMLGVVFSNPIPLWHYPWDPEPDANGGWWPDPDDVSDIMTQFAPDGIRRSHVKNEYAWLERAYEAIGRDGYRPGTFGYIDVFELRDATGAAAFIVKDGNHRLSALAAFGHTDVIVTRDRRQVYDVRAFADWPQVTRGVYSATDATVLIDAYIHGVDCPPRAPQPAVILEDR